MDFTTLTLTGLTLTGAQVRQLYDQITALDEKTRQTSDQLLRFISDLQAERDALADEASRLKQAVA